MSTKKQVKLIQENNLLKLQPKTLFFSFVLALFCFVLFCFLFCFVLFFVFVFVFVCIIIKFIKTYPVYNKLNAPVLHIKGPFFTPISLV